MDLENEMVKFMHPLFGEMAAKTINIQKKKLGLEGDKLSYDEYVELVEAIRLLCKSMAGDAIASKIYDGLKTIIDTEIDHNS